MKLFIQHLNILILNVIILTSISGCALLAPQADPYENDPIAKAVFNTRSSSQMKDYLSDDLNRSQLNQDEDIRDALNSDEIIVGMKMRDVVTLWGKPQNIEVAGDSQQGNQRWTYSDSMSKYFQSQPTRVIYFENGRVVGWEN